MGIPSESSALARMARAKYISLDICNVTEEEVLKNTL
jgi:hypothetical protein